MTDHTIHLDNKTQRFYQGAAAAARVETEHAVVEWPDHEARVSMFWFYVGALAAGEYECTTSEDFTGFALGAQTRAPQRECNHLGQCDPHIVDCKEHPSHT